MRVLKRRHGLWVLANFNGLRRFIRKRWRKVRCWLPERIKRITEDKKALYAHRVIMTLLTTWFAVEALYLVDANFPFPGVDYFFITLRQHFQWFDLWMIHIRPLQWVITIAWLREFAREKLELQPDQIRATLITKSWFAFCIIFFTVAAQVRHDWHLVVITDSSRDLTVFLGWIWLAKRVNRVINPPAKTKSYDGSNQPQVRAKKSQKIVREIIKFLLRSRTK